jgi:hypothetical protein
MIRPTSLTRAISRWLVAIAVIVALSATMTSPRATFQTMAPHAHQMSACGGGAGGGCTSVR